MNVNDLFPSKWLKASDLGEAKPIVTIARVEVESVGREKEQLPVVYFVGKTKGCVLNKTNATAIAAIAGDELTEWPGVKVQLFSAMVEFRGEQVESIRIRAPQQAVAAKQKPKPKPEPEPAEYDDTDDNAPF